jgi:hypothetical protein
MTFRSRFKPIRLIIGLALAITAAAAGLALATRHSSLTLPAVTACAWPDATNAVTISKNSAFNVHNPDTAAASWVMDFAVHDSLRITLSGSAILPAVTCRSRFTRRTARHSP